jgi:hypothetical protein
MLDSGFSMLAAGNWSAVTDGLVAVTTWYWILETRLSAIRTRQNIIEYRESSIAYQMLPFTNSLGIRCDQNWWKHATWSNQRYTNETAESNFCWHELLLCGIYPKKSCDLHWRQLPSAYQVKGPAMAGFVWQESADQHHKIQCFWKICFWPVFRSPSDSSA